MEIEHPAKVFATFYGIHWLNGAWQMVPAIDYPYLGGFVRYHDVNRILNVLDEETLRRTRSFGQDILRLRNVRTSQQRHCNWALAQGNEQVRSPRA